MRVLFSILFYFSCLLISCSNIKGTNISGKINNAGDMSIFLDKVGLTAVSNTRIASDKVKSDGSFTFKIPEGIKKGIYRITIGAKAIELLCDGTEKDVKIEGDLNTIQDFNYTIKGSPLTEKYVGIVQNVIKTQPDAATVQKLALENDPLLGFMIATRLFGISEASMEVNTKVLEKLKGTDYDFVSEYAQMVEGVQKQAAMRLASSKIKVGMDAPEIALPGVDGKIKKLSDYKGKIVLIDFWASWCGPCRKANPHLVEIYNKYKAKGFDVFSVSLDGVDDRTKAALNNDQKQINENIQKSKERWIAAIAQDNLTWPGHVSDLRKWNSVASAEYGVSSIPKTFLVGRDGKIVAVDPRYNLEAEILKVL